MGNALVVVAERRIRTTVVWQVTRKVTARLSWGVVDQAVCSLENFLLSVYVARSLGTAAFGAFSLAYVTYGLANNANRGLAIEPLLVRFSATNTRIWRRAAKSSASTSLLVGMVLGLCAIAAGAIIRGTTGLAFYGLGLVFPAVLLQDSWRYAFFSWGRGYHAFINDIIWLVVQLPLLVLLKKTGHANVFWFVLAWGAGAYVGAIIASLQAKVVPNLWSAKQWLVQHRDLGFRFFIENTGGSASTTLQSYAISYILGIVAIGSIRAAGVLMGPLGIMFYGIGMITVPEAARLLRSSPRRLPLYSLGLSAGLTSLTLAWTALLLVGLPHGIGNLMLGTLWRPTYPLVLPTAVATMAGCLGTGAMVGMHALGKARHSLRATLISSVLVLAFSLLGAAIAGVLGALYFGAAASLIGTLITWWQFREALHEFDSAQVPHWLFPRPIEEHHGPGFHSGQAFTGSGYSVPDYCGDGQSDPGYVGNGYSPSGDGGSHYGNSQHGNSQYGGRAYGAGGYGAQGTASAGHLGTGEAAASAGYRDTAYSGGRFGGAAYGDRGQRGADYQDPGYGQRGYGGSGYGTGSEYGPASARNRSADGYTAGPPYQGDPSARSKRESPYSVADTAQYGRTLSPQEPEAGIPQFMTLGALAAANGNSMGSPPPYGRLSIFTLLDGKAAEFDRLAERAAEGVRTAEPDTLVYVIHVVPTAPMQRVIYELCRDRTAFESHERQPHIQRFAEGRRTCVLAANIIDLGPRYAKIATPGTRQVPTMPGPWPGTPTAAGSSGNGQRRGEGASRQYPASGQYPPNGHRYSHNDQYTSQRVDSDWSAYR